MKEKESYYFRHYADSRQDPKIMRLLMLTGMEGYGIFWSLLEILRTAKEYKILYDKDAIAHQLHSKCELIKTVVENCGLFEVEKDFLYSRPLKEFLIERSEIYRKNAIIGHKNKQLHSNSSTVACNIKESKGKESKGNKTKEDIYVPKNQVKKDLYKEYVYLTEDQYTSLINLFGQELTLDYIDRLNNYIGSKGTKYKSHYHTILNWSKKDEPKSSTTYYPEGNKL